jgi:hypothetical protein
MLVYGDTKRVEDPREKAARLRAGLARLEAPASRIERHAVLVELLVEAGELEQGVLDDLLTVYGGDRPSVLGDAASRLTRAVAGVLLSSFRVRGALPQGEGARLATAPIVLALDELMALELPEEVTVSVPEGFAFYGLYPETFFQAAESLGGEGPLRVIGIRSIGTALAAAVAAVAGERATVFSVRPVGHPFDRRLTVSPWLEQEILSPENSDDSRKRFAVVDEGPGLSGSSFGCVADWLEDRGVDPQAISFFPSHGGDLGPHASERHRRRWSTAWRHVAEFETVFGADSRWPVHRWAEDLTGTPDGPAEDLSAGRWRERLFPDRSQWPAADLQGERRKLLVTAGGRPWLLKFAGLGRYGREKLALAEALGDAGLSPPVVGLRHGFLVGPWLEEARPLPLVPGFDRSALLEAVGRYLAFRIRQLPVSSGERGASPEKLFHMAAFNAGRLLGSASLEEWRERLPEIERLEQPILTDNRMHVWEWLVTSEGRILKTDAVDHHCTNDLVGPQDPAWDLAGAAVELDLTEEELDLLAAATGTTPVQLGFYTVAYLAFQAGRCTLAAEAMEAFALEEAARMRAEVERYSGRLREALGVAAVYSSSQ